ncbi:MATH domain and coiled-coil domain-containing protein At3g58250-like [Alnus glutinosa]|uniref:MATH domain and coiled-coil domain-containing protein At3g58250-like n=1 Tax=Alnus glutinosa TaxID=3517 RepID=UPI002D791C67|nr:MATH domain and coiled-coil domain-containing protein At3g58250-like [Alnus glutinosa]
MTEWGFAQLLSHDILNESSNGYLVDDTCVFGVEVFVIKGTCRGENLSMVNQPQPNYFTWRIDDYSALKDEVYLSEQFIVEGRRWLQPLSLYFEYGKLRLEPEGGGAGANKYLSIYLCLDDDLESLPPNRKLYSKYKVRIRNQINNNHLEKTAEYWFSDSVTYGFPKFLSKIDLQDTSQDYLIDDGLFIEYKIDVKSVVKDFSSN